MKLFALSDIHGFFTEMKKALDNAGFDPQNPQHLLVSCGDAMDRGHQPREVIEFLNGLPNKVLICGNHEILMEDAIRRKCFLAHDYHNGTANTAYDFCTKENAGLMSHAQILGELKKLLDVDALEINMRNNKFVEKIISDKPEKEFDIRIPESQLDNYISSNEELRKLSYRTLFHKCFIENIDEYFPYMEMSLKEIGIPLFDILQVSTNKGQFFVELSADANYYKL